MPITKPFPDETFVREALLTHFTAQGYQPVKRPWHDLVLVNPQGRTWILELKGGTKDFSTDLDIALGQILRRMHDEQAFYALGFPEGYGYEQRYQDHISPWMKQRLQLSIFTVRQDATLILPPNILI